MAMTIYCNKCGHWKTLDKWHWDLREDWSELCKDCCRTNLLLVQEKDDPITGGGIYVIKNLVDGKSTSYIGSTVQSFGDRWKRHRHDLRHGIAHNSHLQNAWDKYGRRAFEFSVLEVVNGDYGALIEREQFWLDVYQKKGPTYNKGEVTRSPRFGIYKIQPYPAFLNEKTGETIPAGDDLVAMCQEKGLNHVCLRNVIVRRTRSHRGCVLADESLRPPKRKKYKRRKYAHSAFYNYKTGAMIPASDDLYTICEQRELNYVCMKAICRGAQYRHRGWMLEENKDKPLPALNGAREASAKSYPGFYNLESGEIIPPGINLSELCRKKNLTISCMFKVKGKWADRHKNWVLLERKEEIIEALAKRGRIARKQEGRDKRAHRYNRIQNLECYNQVLSLGHAGLNCGRIAQFVHAQGESLDIETRSLEHALRRHFAKHPELGRLKGGRINTIPALGCYDQVLSLKRNNLSNGKIARFIHDQEELPDMRVRTLEQSLRRYFIRHPELFE